MDWKNLIKKLTTSAIVGVTIFSFTLAGFLVGNRVGEERTYTHLSEVVKLKKSYEDLRKTYEVVSDVTGCESEYLHDALNSSGAYGIAQFKKATFYELAGKAKINNVSWRDTGDQLTVLNWALDNNYGYHWVCYEG